MSEQDFGEILSVSLDKIRSMADAETVVGHPICAPGGLTDMALSAADLGADSTKVAGMQMLRLVSVIALYPTIIGCLVR